MKKSLLSVLLAAALMLSFAVGCGQKSEPPVQSSSGAPDSSPTSSQLPEAGSDDWMKPFEKPVKLTIGRSGNMYSYPEGDDYANNAYTRWIKETFNIEIETAFFLQEGYNEKINLLMTSGDLPDVVQINDYDQLNQIMDAGMSADLTDAIGKYSSGLMNKLIESYGGKEKAFQKVSRDGKILAYTSFEPGYQYGLTWIRKDWLDKAKFSTPTTLEELVAAMKKFVELDLAGGGKTLGLDFANQENGFIAGNYNTNTQIDPLVNYFEAYPKLWYQDENGNYVYGSIQPQVKEALAFLAQLYKDGLIDKEFAIKDVRASIAAGRPGVVCGAWWIPGYPLSDTIKNIKDSQYIPLAILSKDDKYHTYTQNFSSNWYVVNAKCSEDQIKATAILRNFGPENNMLTGEEGKDMKDYGFTCTVPNEVRDAYKNNNGVDWGAWPMALQSSVDDLKLRQSQDLKDGYEKFLAGNTDGMTDNDKEDYTLIRSYADGKETWGSETFANAWVKYASLQGKSLMLDLKDKLEILPNIYPATTNTMELKWSNLQTMEQQMWFKIIMGEEPVGYFDTFIEQWKAQGGEEITKEVNEQMK